MNGSCAHFVTVNESWTLPWCLLGFNCFCCIDSGLPFSAIDSGQSTPAMTSAQARSGWLECAADRLGQTLLYDLVWRYSVSVTLMAQSPDEYGCDFFLTVHRMKKWNTATRSYGCDVSVAQSANGHMHSCSLVVQTMHVMQSHCSSWIYCKLIVFAFSSTPAQWICTGLLSRFWVNTRHLKSFPYGINATASGIAVQRKHR